jgi:hypothetical protein
MTVIPEAGKRYVCRDGSITDPLEEFGDVWLVDHGPHGMIYSSDDHAFGWRVFPIDEEDHPKDLMREYVE